MNVSACLVTRGDVDMQPVIDSLPQEWEIILWDNGAGTLDVLRPVELVGRDVWTFAEGTIGIPVADLAVYGRYAAIGYASHDLIYVQDDDVIVSDPQAIVDAWMQGANYDMRDISVSEMIPMFDPIGVAGKEPVVCNMPAEFRPHYPDSALVGFGAAFHRDAPARAFWKYAVGISPGWCPGIPGSRTSTDVTDNDVFRRRADNIFTVLTPRVFVDIPKQDREMASDPNRMWKHPGHEAEKQRMIELARRVRDA